MRNLLSIVLLVAAAVMIAVAGYLYYEDRQNTDDLPPPPSNPGDAELKNVFDAVGAQGIEVEYGRGGARINGISTAGQELIVDDQSLFVFIFASPDERAADMSELQGQEVTLVDTFGDPLETETTHVFEGSNVVAVLTAGSDDLAESVAAAVASIP